MLLPGSVLNISAAMHDNLALFCSLSQDAGLLWLSDEFSLCAPLKNKNDAVSFKNWLQETWVNLAMVDYPYEANFLQPLPRWPIQVYEISMISYDN